MKTTTLSAAPVLDSVLRLSHELGREDRSLAILGEGNTSGRLDADRFLVKASGSSLGSLSRDQLTACRFEPLLQLLEEKQATDQHTDEVLLDSRCVATARRPSVEALFHAYLLTLPGVGFVGHTHPTSVNKILCSLRAAEFALNRHFPDEIVCCGEYSVLVPYADPGLKLARLIRERVEFHRKANGGDPPRLILLCNHGLIALGPTPEAVLATTLMAEKAAEIFVGATALSGPRGLTRREIERISRRPDEHHRRKVLGL